MYNFSIFAISPLHIAHIFFHFPQALWLELFVKKGADLKLRDLRAIIRKICKEWLLDDIINLIMENF